MAMDSSQEISRRRFGQLAATTVLSASLGGCSNSASGISVPDKVWGSLGGGKGQFSKPRAIAIDAEDQLYIVDMTARIQVFDVDGNYLRGWQTPEHKSGRPTGLTISSIDGNLMVADTHYFRILTYTPMGKLLERATLGGTMGQGPSEYGLVSDVVRDRDGNYYISEYGEWDRIHKLSPKGEFVKQWGGHGSEPGQFLRPQHIEFDADEKLWVADACNHRIQVFDREGKLVTMWGTPGSEPGQLYYPYCLGLDGKGHLYVCEYGNHRVQKFTLDGKSVGCWGGVGRKPGQLNNPWAFVIDSRGRIHVLDSMNHRVQRFWL
ncbi:MAG TPA: NHL repeat-containing protein [Lacipirellulaceae bacterium]|nr:NHL repeat-containing protein [Lacipirellulaceae bacterium]